MIAKVHYQTDQQNLLEHCGGRMFDLVNTERVFTKRASSNVFGPETIAQYKPDKDHFLAHLIILGDQEHFGFNRNGDSFPKLACTKYHTTFVKYGHMFREHRNRSVDEAIGQIKASAYDERIGRIELLVWGHKKKAEKEYEMAKSGKNLSWSMSCRVPYDTCSCCGNQAKRASLYCDCLKHNMTRYMPRFKKYAFAINDLPTFFDASSVENPADRIAHYLEFRFGEDLQKAAAAATTLITGADWAEFENVQLPGVAVDLPLHKLALCQRLADHENYLDGDRSGDAIKCAFSRLAPDARGEELSDEELQSLRTARPGTLFREFAKRGAVLPFLSFAAYALNQPIAEVVKSPVVKRAAVIHLPRIFNRLLKGSESDMASMFDADSEFSSQCDGGCTDDVQKFMDGVEQRFGCNTEAVRHRVLTITIKSGSARRPEGSALVEDHETEIRANNLAQAYGYYKLAALSSIADLRGENTMTDAQELLMAADNREIFR